MHTQGCVNIDVFKKIFKSEKPLYHNLISKQPSRRYSGSGVLTQFPSLGEGSLRWESDAVSVTGCDAPEQGPAAKQQILTSKQTTKNWGGGNSI